MRPGSLIGDFEIERLAGSGAMGAVHRAHHRTTGALVALKVLHGHRPDHAERFAREARVLSELNHPGIVRYVAHGVTPEGDPYLAMEWLEGESLADRLARQPLTVAESLSVGLAVAEALSVPHRMGIVHRDLKPSNLLLVGGRTDRVTVMDFGIARMLDAGGTMLTATGAMLGTPGYMAPEQARGEPDVDARADVFALGAVLFQCLTGRPAFDGEDLLAILMKTAMEDAPRSSERRPDIPLAVDDLVARMLARAAAERPTDAGDVAAQLAAAMRAPGLPPPPGASRMLSRFDARTSCLLVARPAPATRGATAVLPALRYDVKTLASVARSHDGTLAMLADGSVVVAFTDDPSPAEQAARAARCALALRPLLPGTRMALVASTAQPTVGATLIDRAVRALTSAGEDTIVLDEAAAGCLPAGFTLAPAGAGRTLLGETRLLGPFPASTQAPASTAPGDAPRTAVATRAPWPGPAGVPPTAVPTRGSTEVGHTINAGPHGSGAAQARMIAPGGVPRRSGMHPYFWLIFIGGALVVLAIGIPLVLGILVGINQSGVIPVSAPAFSVSCPALRCEPLNVPDPSRVDAVALFPRAKQLAEATERNTKLLNMIQTGRGDGTADVSRTGKGYIQYTFQHRAADGSQSGVVISVHLGQMMVSRVSLGDGGLSVPDPTCSAARVIKAVGPIADNATVSFTYASIGSGGTYMVSTDGPDRGGFVDGRTCTKTKF